jgi:PAS domain-containing protein
MWSNLYNKWAEIFCGCLSGVVATDPSVCNITLIDITEREAEAALRNSKEKYSDLLNNLVEGIVVHAPDSSIILSNPKASELLGLSEDQIIGKQIMDPDGNFWMNAICLYQLLNTHLDFLANKKPLKKFYCWDQNLILKT